MFLQNQWNTFLLMLQKVPLSRHWSWETPQGFVPYIEFAQQTSTMSSFTHPKCWDILVGRLPLVFTCYKMEGLQSKAKTKEESPTKAKQFRKSCFFEKCLLGEGKVLVPRRVPANVEQTTCSNPSKKEKFEKKTCPQSYMVMTIEWDDLSHPVLLKKVSGKKNKN